MQFLSLTLPFVANYYKAHTILRIDAYTYCMQFSLYKLFLILAYIQYISINLQYFAFLKPHSEHKPLGSCFIKARCGV